MDIEVKILRNDRRGPAGKLADAEIHFISGELAGLKLVGFAIWQRRDGQGENVSFPARNFTIDGDRRSFSLLRWIAKREAQERLETAVLEAYRHQAPIEAAHGQGSTH